MSDDWRLCGNFMWINYAIVIPHAHIFITVKMVCPSGLFNAKATLVEGQ